MSELEQRKVDRLRVMDAIYKQTGADEHHDVPMVPIQQKLGFGDKYMSEIVFYLVGEGLIRPGIRYPGGRTPMQARITHAGIKEMEELEEQPDKPTHHFPPSNGITINVRGDMIGSPTMVGNVNSSQHNQVGDVTIGADSKKAIADFVAEFEAKTAELTKEKSAEAVSEMAAEVATIKAQINSPKPKKHFVAESLASVRAILENGVGGMVTSGLAILLHQIHL